MSLANGSELKKRPDRTAFAEPVIFKPCYPKKPTHAENIRDEVEIFDACHKLIHVGIVRNIGDEFFAGQGVLPNGAPTEQLLRNRLSLNRVILKNRHNISCVILYVFIRKENMLNIKHLTKTYGSKKAVDDLSLHIAPGEIYGFIGHNGAGKTTTLKSCVGILQFDAGEILVNGTSVRKDPLTCKKLIAYIPDNPDIKKGRQPPFCCRKFLLSVGY